MTIRSPITVLAIALLLITTGCANKAKSVQLGAEQFAQHSEAAIASIDAFRNTELAVTPLSPEAAQKKFIELILNSKDDIERKTLEQAMHPLRRKPTDADGKWQDFLGTLRRHHEEFTRIFARLDQGSFFAAPKVKETIPTLNKLIGELVAFADTIKATPAEMTRERANIAINLEIIRDSDKDQTVKELQAAEFYQQLQVVEAREQQVTQDVLEHSLKAALVGKELRTLLQQYDQLSIDDITEGISLALSLSGQVLGKDLSALNQKAAGVTADIKKDPDLNALFTNALTRISDARK